MTKRAIYITQYDLQRLRPLVKSARHFERADCESLDLLQEELDRAIVSNSGDLPEGVVTMNSRVTVIDLETAKKTEFTIVFPRDANYDDRRISVLAPIGTALLGYRAGMQVEWPTPGGLRRFHIEHVQPSPKGSAVARVA